jgi:hypothetical protein
MEGCDRLREKLWEERDQVPLILPQYGVLSNYDFPITPAAWMIF